MAAAPSSTTQFGNLPHTSRGQVPIGVLEVVGGFAILVGLLTRIASILFIIEMIGAPLLTKISEGFVGGYELDLLLMAISISLLLTGPGKISRVRYFKTRNIS